MLIYVRYIYSYSFKVKFVKYYLFNSIFINYKQTVLKRRRQCNFFAVFSSIKNSLLFSNFLFNVVFLLRSLYTVVFLGLFLVHTEIILFSFEFYYGRKNKEKY